MKAFVSRTYGGPDVLELSEVDVPEPGTDEVLVKVRSISVNPADWHCLRGKPVFSRATLGPIRPKATVLGADIAGRVESVGPGVTTVAPGDAVYACLFGSGFGGFAEYARVPLGALAPIPAGLSDAEAAALPIAATTALRGLDYHGRLEAGRSVLVNGGSGGVGHFGIQLAKAAGAEVTAVTSTPNLDLVRTFGADHVIDYTAEDFTRTGQTYDLVLDTIGNRRVGDLRRALGQSGRAAVTGFTSVGMLVGVVVRGGKRIKQVNVQVTGRNLAELNTFVEAGALRPSIDRHYSFAEIPEAISYLEAGHARGKVVVDVVGA
ncbi:NAD(P)-dependent alcohol dehydrogenase [Aldersonia sp. NBC_00410]|uniref:NAD(P)-dependent alcohol dehydrogenase n=1 Tax=Aldersonia sp. NBC_00410 TaxID=2975954 RepID=UPI00225B92BA|nr:NAD(P)-dependent alcohol dehydrogenase [Aldersonia sp. NBC_00410]MCX5042939.1 NAD(P)-dependent alcohol dehydrogenase [Aldersonia sp. NBC_00410]